MPRRHRIADGQLTLDFRVEIECPEERVEPHPDGGVERWRPAMAPGYEVSDRGRLRNPKGKILSPGRTTGGHRQFRLRGRGYYVHRLVLQAFVGPCPDGWVCRHLDGDPANNHLDNLEWGTEVENCRDGQRHGTVRRHRPKPRDDIFTDPFVPLEAVVPWEVWKEPPGFPGYEVSNFGRFRSYYRKGGWRTRMEAHPEPRKIALNRQTGYACAYLYVSPGKMVARTIHRLVIETFSPRPTVELLCRHLDGDKLNNRLSNLRWGTRLDNGADAVKHGDIRRGSRCHNAKLTEDKAREIKRRLAAGERGCDLSREFRVSQTVVCAIGKGRIWKHL